MRSLGVGSPPIHRFDLIYIERERDRFVVGRVWGGGIRHLARFPLVCSALSPPAKLNSVE